MMSLAQIQYESAKTARRAAREGKRPYILWPEDLESIRQAGRFPFPFIGSYVPRGWKLVETFFVDSSGFGAPGEPALTTETFAAKLEVGFGYAVVEAGQFQVYVGKFPPPKPKQ